MARNSNDDSGARFADDEQTEKIRHWWKKNGLAIVVGLVVGVGSVAGYQGWGMFQERRAESASDLYQALLRSFEGLNIGLTREIATQLVSEYESTPYAEGSLLMLAKLSVDDGDLDSAETFLQRVIEISPDAAIQHVARLRLAAVALDRGDLEKGEELLSIKEKGSFVSHYSELQGDIFMARGELKDARQAYEDALATKRTESVSTQILRRKLNWVTRDKSE